MGGGGGGGQGWWIRRGVTVKDASSGVVGITKECFQKHLEIGGE